ncbi:MAG: class I SAM-dependent methyltransferase [Desulfobacterales bacterium]
MALSANLKILSRMLLAPIRGATHAKRLESFYASQAEGYDDFRRRLLLGRRELIRELDFAPGEVWLDMGAGTGANLEFIAPVVPCLRQVYLVDLSRALLGVAQQRIARDNWSNVTPVRADAVTFRPPLAVDVITISYALTMIPDWIQAVNHARTLLKPGGRIGVVDFYVSRKYPAPGRIHHGWWRRNIWPLWFQGDNVFLSSDHLPYLNDTFRPGRVVESLARLPYLPLVKVPYYRFIGTRIPN